MIPEELVKSARKAYVDLIKAAENLDKEIQEDYEVGGVIESIKRLENIGRVTCKIADKATSKEDKEMAKLLSYGCVKVIERLSRIALEELERDLEKIREDK